MPPKMKPHLYNSESDLKFEEEVAIKLFDNGYKIYGRNVIWKDESNIRILEIDILLYKTIVECKNTNIKNVGDKKFMRQLNKFIDKFPDFQIVFWFSKIDREDDSYIELKTNYPNIIFTDNIYDFIREYTPPKEFFFIREPEVLWSLIARNNTNNYDHILPFVKINPFIIDCVECYLNDPIEEINLLKLKEKIILTNKIDPSDIYITCRKNYDFTHGIPIYNRFFLKIERVKQSSNSLPRFVIEGCHVICTKCNKIYTIKRMIRNLCNKCY